MVRLGVNIDHVATVRQARRTVEPDPVAAAALCELAGADGITVHLREDRRHMQDRDVEILRKTVRTRLNLEMAVAEEIVAFAERLRPDHACLVPERREEVTTEGGLDVAGNLPRVAETVKRLRGAGVIVSLFVDPSEEQVRAAARSGAQYVELHTGRYADARGEEARRRELETLAAGAAMALREGLRVNAGHGLTYWNVRSALALPGLEELNIGHSIISRAVLVGLERAVREMKELIRLGPEEPFGSSQGRVKRI
ncbi:MAG: pyridoxine 5'-phosphate synthase [Candidatus Aureabacteria bacterium]|nr:pyridoxine 5'-phosphate synthase [Candidatus Auribacterota bacterium]HOE26744.1 pyridoxine 5'-phosphate synthase [bacterium]HQM51724.1 pyridoxine 5'-phosphate synthase [bacterium]